MATRKTKRPQMGRPLKPARKHATEGGKHRIKVHLPAPLLDRFKAYVETHKLRSREELVAECAEEGLRRREEADAARA